MDEYKKKNLFSNFTAEAFEIGFCTQVLFSEPKKYRIQVQIINIGGSFGADVFGLPH